jgi:hypothetical protein
MKAYTRLLAGLFFAALPAAAQKSMPEQTSSVSLCDRISAYSRPYLEKAVRGYGEALRSDIDGVVESSITYATVLRIAAPQLNMNAIRAEINDLAANGETPVIRYKAYLATIVFQDPQEFESAVGSVSPESNQFFSTVADQVSKRLFGFRSE